MEGQLHHEQLRQKSACPSPTHAYTMAKSLSALALLLIVDRYELKGGITQEHKVQRGAPTTMDTNLVHKYLEVPGMALKACGSKERRKAPECLLLEPGSSSRKGSSVVLPDFA